MRKFLVAALVSVAVLASTIPAHADNSEEVIIGVLGGALGGLIIGEVLGNRQVMAAPVVVAPAVPVYEEYYPGAPVQCVYDKRRLYDPNLDVYVVMVEKVCYR